MEVGWEVVGEVMLIRESLVVCFELGVGQEFGGNSADTGGNEPSLIGDDVTQERGRFQKYCYDWLC